MDRDKNEYKLAKVLGTFEIMASAISQEYGSGINYVSITVLSIYPAVGNLVPLAMFLTGIILLPKVYIFQKFSQIIPRSGGQYVWISRTTTPALGFILQFIWWIGIVSAIGFLSYVSGTFLASTLSSLGYQQGTWFNTVVGHLVLGLIIIWTVFLLHYSGVKSYGIFVSILFAIVLLAALIPIIIGFLTPTSFYEYKLSELIHGNLSQTPTYESLNYNSIVGTMTLLIFAYGGLSAAPFLGGEAKNATKTMPKGITLGWLGVLILFTLVSAAVFHVSPASLDLSLLKSKEAFYATVPGIISVVAPKSVGILLQILVTIIVIKTVAPQMLTSSRTIFALSQDGIFPKLFMKTNNHKAPSLALLMTAILGSIFLVDTVLIGVNIVALRSVSVLLIMMFLGLGVLNIAKYKKKEEWQKHVSTLPTIIASLTAIVVALFMIPSVIILPKTPIYLQPSFQLLVAVVVSIMIYQYAKYYNKKKYNIDLDKEIKTKLPLE